MLGAIWSLLGVRDWGICELGRSEMRVEEELKMESKMREEWCDAAWRKWRSGSFLYNLTRRVRHKKANQDMIMERSCSQ